MSPLRVAPASRLSGFPRVSGDEPGFKIAEIPLA